MKKLAILLLLQINSYANQCKLINLQCLDNSPSKIVNGVEFTLKDTCSRLGLSGDKCCWNNAYTYYCGDVNDGCSPYRKNPNCTFVENTCKVKDSISGSCQTYNSKYICADRYTENSQKICTNIACVSNESSEAKKCYEIQPPNPKNTKDLEAITISLQMGQNLAQNMNCRDINNPSKCTLFAGKYFSCYLYAFQAGQPGTWNNNGADCMIHHDAFIKAGVPLGYNASDHNLYSQATSGTNNIMGGSVNYSLSNDNNRAINNSVNLQQQSKSPVVNQDENINYTPNNSRNSKLNVRNGQVVSVTINKDTVRDLRGFTAFEKYLSDTSVNLAWNKQKAEADPDNIKNITFANLGVTRQVPPNAFNWHSSLNAPLINGLCVHLGDYCEGGDNDATVSDWIKATLSWAGGFTNPNFCAKCTKKLFGHCVWAEPRQTIQQWCCYDSKVALAITLAAYDQGLIDFYNHGDRYTEQIQHKDGYCSAITIETLSKIDFSKGNYFEDLISNIDVSKIINDSNFTNNNFMNNTFNRGDNDATKIVQEWDKNK